MRRIVSKRERYRDPEFKHMRVGKKEVARLSNKYHVICEGWHVVSKCRAQIGNIQPKPDQTQTKPRGFTF